MILLSPPWWQSFPWSAVGAVGVVIGFIIGALKLATAWGKAAQRDVEHERRLLMLEGKTEGVPDEVQGEVSKRYASVESEACLLRRHLTRVDRAQKQMRRELDHMRWRCENEHGPFSQVTSVTEDSDELLLTPPRAAEASHEPKG
jgi:uncharacterized membrane-anchored protein YhcB (DUF1043 family)